MTAIAAVKTLPIGPASGVSPASASMDSGRSFSEVLSGNSISGSGDGGLQHAARGVLGDLEAGRKRLDEIISQARAGKTFRPVELLAMQAEVNSIGEQMALSQKLVSEGVSSVKRLWSMQV